MEMRKSINSGISTKQWNILAHVEREALEQNFQYPKNNYLY